MGRKIVITSEYFGRFSPAGKELLLTNGFTVVDNPFQRLLKEEDMLGILDEAEGIIADLEPITARVIAAAPKLKIIARRGVGVDSIDLEAAKTRGIIVARTPGAVEKPTADLAMTFILTLARRIPGLNEKMKKRIWEKELGSSLEGKRLGIAGLGNIGQALVKRAQAFDMEVVYYDPMRKEDKEQTLGVTYLPWEELLKTSDFISLHLPLLPETKYIINYETMKLMKNTAYLINTARGPIVNEADLARALKEGLIAGAGIDVFAEEPTTTSPLMDAPNVILTPHVATFTREVFIKMDVMAAQNIVDYFQKGTCLT